MCAWVQVCMGAHVRVQMYVEPCVPSSLAREHSLELGSDYNHSPRDISSSLTLKVRDG